MLFAWDSGSIDWNHIINAFLANLPATLTAGAAFIAALAALRKSQTNEQKLDLNTKLTKETNDQSRQAKEVAAKADSAAEKSSTLLHEVKAAVTETTKAINGRMDEMLHAARERAYAEGKLAGIAEAKATIQPAIALVVKDGSTPVIVKRDSHEAKP